MPLVEYAKSGSATCWKCGRKIGINTLRLQASVGGGDGDGSDSGFGQKKWMHLRCYRPNSVVDTAWFKGADQLKDEDKERLKQLIAKWNDRKAVGGPGLLSQRDPNKPKKPKVEKPPKEATRKSARLATQAKEEGLDDDDEDYKPTRQTKRRKAGKNKTDSSDAE